MKNSWFFVTILLGFNTTLMAAENGQSMSSLYVLPDLSLRDSEVARISADINAPTGGSKLYGSPKQIGTLVQFDRLLTPQTTGEWQSLDTRRDIWRAQLILPGALWVDTALNNLQLPQGTEIIITDSKDRVAWHYSAEDLHNKKVLYTAAVPGEALRIEAIVPRGLRRQFDLEVGGSTFGIDDLFLINDSDPLQSGACNVDVVCPVEPAFLGIQDNMRSVGRYTFQSGGGTYVCTGALIANQEGQNHTPYFLTANHCLNNQSEAATVVVYWNYQSDYCRAPGSIDSGTPLPLEIASHTQSGAQWRASYSPTDFTLLEFDQQPPAGADTFYAGWYRPPISLSGPWASVYSIHHPSGHEKRIAMELDQIESSGYGENAGVGGDSHLRVADWDVGTTEGGSSGAPLFRAGLIIGQLHGGEAACGNNAPDWYGAFASSWHGGGTNQTQLQHWLDPDYGVDGVITVIMYGYEGP